MIERITGVLLAVEPMAAVVDMHGLGVRVELTPGDVEGLGAPGGRVTLLTHLLVSGKDPIPRLMGFRTREGRELFRHLVSVSGVGPSSALRLLSAKREPQEVARAIAENDAKALKVKGIGPKIAKRVITELRDKMASLTGTEVVEDDGLQGARAGEDPFTDALLALRGLEFDPDEARRLVGLVRKELGKAPSADEIVRAVLVRA